MSNEEQKAPAPAIACPGCQAFRAVADGAGWCSEMLLRLGEAYAKGEAILVGCPQNPKEEAA